MPTKRKSRLPVRVVVAVLSITVLLGALGAGVFWIYQRGVARDTGAARIKRALRDEDFDLAANLARKLLATNPKGDEVSRLLVESLFRAGRLDEAIAEASKLVEQGRLQDYAREFICRAAMQKGDLDMADRVARSLNESDPDLAHRILALIKDFRGLTSDNPVQRLGAAATYRGLASITSSEEARASALIAAASISLEVAPFLPSSAGLVRRARTDLQDAVTAVGNAYQADHAFPYEFHMGLIRALSADETEAKHGADTLRKYARGLDRQENAIALLALYHLRRQEWVEAVDQIRELSDGYFWRRVFWVLKHAKLRDVALKVLDSGPNADRPDRILRRADLLLSGGSEEDAARGLELLTKLISDPATDTEVCLRALVVLALKVDVATARSVADQSGIADRDDRRIMALLAFLLSASDEDPVRARELARELADDEYSSAESRDLLRLLGGGRDTLQVYLDERVEQGGESALQYRLQRAFNKLAIAKGEKDTRLAAKLRAEVMEDLGAVLTDEDAPKVSILGAFGLATSIGQTGLAGQLLGRALAMPGEPDPMLPVHVLEAAYPSTDQDGVRALAAGVEDIAPTTEAPAFLRAFAHTMVSQGKHDKEMITELERAANTDTGSKLPALELACRIAIGQELLDRAETHARSILVIEPESAVGRELLGAILLRRQAFEEVLRLYEHGEKTEPGYYQLVGALLALNRNAEAHEVAQRALNTFVKSPRAYIVLARTHLAANEPRKALGILNIAPPSIYIALFRAELLVSIEDYPMAEQLYEAILLQTRYQNQLAWVGLFRVLAATDRTQEFIERSGNVLAGTELEKFPEVRAAIHHFRGQAHEMEGHLNEALADYEKSIALHGEAWSALNNAAWHIATLSPARIETAREYIDRAMKIRPNDVAVLDTAAEVYSVQGDHDAAVKHIDNALALRPAGKVARYSVHKARILIRADRKAEARGVLSKVREEYPDDPAAKQAKEILWKLDLEEEAKEEDS